VVDPVGAVVEQLVVAVETLAGSPELRDSLGENGRRRAAEIFDHNVMVDRIEARYEQIA
jgi:glycosyltransferase involved in cell wall biosynthesis